MERTETMKVARGLRLMVSPRRENHEDKVLGVVGLLILGSKLKGRKCCGGKNKNNLRWVNGTGDGKGSSFSLLRIMLFCNVKSLL